MKFFRKLLTNMVATFVAICLFYGTYNRCCCISAKLDQYVQSYADQNFFSGAVLVAKDGKILLCKAYGLANLELNVPNKLNTKFRIASMTKSFTAMAIMQLLEMGRLDLQDPLSKYIPDYPRGNEITIHHLLSHTSRIPHYINGEYDKKEKIQSYTLETRIALFKNKPLDFNPGERLGYSDNGYILLTYIIEKASGKTYEKFLKEHIFDPLSMKDSGCDDYKRILKNRASGYTMFGTNADYIDMSYLAGAGALYSTIEDLYRWDQALYADKLISKKSIEMMFTPIRDNNGYGWGILASDGPQGKIVGYAGQTDGFTSFIVRYIDHKVCIIVLSNYQEAPVGKISQNLGLMVFGQKPVFRPKKHAAIILRPEIYDQYVGSYKFRGKKTIFLITKEQDKLFAQVVGEEKCEIYPKSETEFFYKYADVQISFIKSEGDKVAELILHQDGRDSVAEKFVKPELNLSTWQYAIEQKFAAKRAGKIDAKDKKGASVTFEWQITNGLESKYVEIMHSLTDLFVEAFAPNEIRFLKEHPEAALRAGPNDPYKELVPLFKNGVESVEWKKVEEAMALMARSYWKSKTSEKEMHKYANSQFIFVIAKDTVTQKLLGFSCYQIDDDNPQGAVILEPLAVAPEAQSRGIGKLLTASIFKLLPEVTRIALTVESKNAIALKAYQAWGFIFVEYPGTDASHKTMEYLAEKCDNLQKIARTLRD